VALFLASLAALALATARPDVSIEVPLGRTSIILALDVSRSMCATDVQPNRLAVAQEAARTFVEDQVAGTRIGIVAFAGFAELIVPPTTDKDDLTDAIDHLTTSRGTVIGAATMKSVDAIAAVNPDVPPIGADLAGRVTAPGEYVPDIVVLLTDGANTRGIGPVEAAQHAADRGVRVYTIGFGTTTPTEMVCTREQLGADVLFEGGFAGGGPPGNFRQFLVIDEPTLRSVADLTGGAFYRAEDADQLRDVFASLPNQIELQQQDREVTVGFAIGAAVLVAAAMVLALRWRHSS
jgi:Ca-activated chloride channel family protein